MWFKLTFLSSLALVCSLAFAEEMPECGSAVDAADRLAPDSDKHCDYTKTGLNGVLHKALSGKKNTGEESAEPAAQNINEQRTDIAADKLIAKGEFNSPQQLQTVKFSLLGAAAAKCPKGFVMESEQYVPSATKAMRLELIFHCL
ncbi:MAG TPA: hypothetical protein PK002_08125 [Cellvibrio sp.]|nr:hypothetical protein [Cellvibrio sp.]